MTEEQSQYTIAFHEPTDQRKHPAFLIFDRPIAFHRCFVTLTGSVAAALMLSQAVYWSQRTTLPGGWFYKSSKEWEEETGLTLREQRTARAKLLQLGWWQEEVRKAHGNPTVHYRINAAEFSRSLRSLDMSLEAYRDGASDKSYTETTAETTTIFADVAAAPSGDDPQGGFLQEEEPPKAQEKVTMRKGRTPRSLLKLDPQTKAMISTMLFGTPRPAPLQQNHVNIAKVWRGMQDMGLPLSEVLQWYNEAWPLDWRGKTGQHPTPTQLLNGVAAWRAEVKAAAPTYREELVLLEEDDE